MAFEHISYEKGTYILIITALPFYKKGYKLHLNLHHSCQFQAKHASAGDVLKFHHHHYGVVKTQLGSRASLNKADVSQKKLWDASLVADWLKYDQMHQISKPTLPSLIVVIGYHFGLTDAIPYYRRNHPQRRKKPYIDTLKAYQFRITDRTSRTRNLKVGNDVKVQTKFGIESLYVTNIKHVGHNRAQALKLAPVVKCLPYGLSDAKHTTYQHWLGKIAQEKHLLR